MNRRFSYNQILSDICLAKTPYKRFRYWRIQCGLRLHQIGKISKQPHSIYADYELGRRKNPGILTIQKMARLLYKYQRKSPLKTYLKFNEKKMLKE